MERSTPAYTGATRLWGPFFPRYHAGVLHVGRRVRGPGSGQVPSGGSQGVIPVAMREVVERFLQGGGREPLQPDDYVFFAGDGAMEARLRFLELRFRGGAPFAAGEPAGSRRGRKGGWKVKRIGPARR